MIKPHKGQILIVDDEEHQLLLYKRVLSSEDYEIFTAADGAGAIEMAKKHQPQLVLLDIVLPDTSGIDVLKTLKNQPETQHCFVVLISSKLVSSEDQSEGLETGADAYLLKPIQNRELIARIDSFMRHKTAIDDLRKRDEHLRQIEWMLEDKQLMDEESYFSEYGDLSELNQNGLILNSVGREQLRDIASEYLDLLETSAAIYERNGDYALGLFSTGWCQMMDKASHALCNTTSTRKALDSGKWLCHESCWKDAALKAIEEGKPVDIECNGGIYLYAVPVKSGGNIVGVINFGYGDPPKDEKKLNELSERYKIPVDELREKANAYQTRPGFIVELAKKRLRKSAVYLEYIIDRKLAESALHRSEENLRVTLDSIGDAVIATDIDGCITRMNPVAESLTGWQFDDIKNKSLKDVFRIVNSLTGEKVENPVSKVLSTGRLARLANHTKLISKNGKEFQISDSAAPIKNDEGKVIGVVLVFKDVTRDYRMQEKLKASEERYRTVFENTGTATCIIEKDGTISLVNKKFTELASSSVENIENKKTWMEFVLPENLVRMKEQHELRRKNSEVALKEYDFRFIDKNQNLKHIQLYIDIIPGTDTSVASLLDLTEHKKAKEKLAHSHLLMQYIIEHTKSGVAVHDKNLRYIYVSKRYLDQYKVNEENVIGRCHYDVFPDLPQKWRDVHQRALKGETLSADRDPFYRADGSVEWTRWQCLPWHDSAGEIDGFIVYTEVITDQIKAEQELKENINELEKFNRAMVDRENRMIELKQEINELLKKLGQNRKYRLPDETEEELQQTATELKIARNASLNLIEDLTDEIEKRKKYEKELKESEERFSIAFKESPAPLVISEIETGLFIDVNSRWVELLGYSREEQIGKTSKEVGIWRNPSERDRVIQHVLKNGFFKNEYIEFNTKSGEVILALWSAETIRHSGKDLMLSMIHDITARVKADRELRILKETLEKEVEEKTQELRQRIIELERFQVATIEREFRIKVLRDEIEKLKGEEFQNK